MLREEGTDGRPLASACPGGGGRESGAVQFGARAYCVSNMLLLPLLVCSSYKVQIQIGKYLMILSMVLLRVQFFDK